MKRFILFNDVGVKIKRHERFIEFTRFKLSPIYHYLDCIQYKFPSKSSTEKEKRATEGHKNKRGSSSQSKTSLESSSFQSSLLFSSSQEKLYGLSAINTTLNLPTMTGILSNPITPFTTPPVTPPTPPVSYRFGVMPRPGQPGALHFDNMNISEFLRR